MTSQVQSVEKSGRIEGTYDRSGDMEKEFEHRPMSRDRKRVLLVAGGLGVLSAALIAAAPELGLASAVASVVAGGASAATTLLARR